MTDVFIITNPLRFYSERGFFSSEKPQPRILSKGQFFGKLAKSIPIDPQITIYFNQEATTRALQAKGYSNTGYFSQITPLILQVELKEDLKVQPSETQRTIDWTLIGNENLIAPNSTVKLAEPRQKMKNIPTSFLFGDLCDRIKLPFSRALNPTLTDSGIALSWGGETGMQGCEIDDLSVSKTISKAFNKKYGFLLGLQATFHILVGCHYPDRQCDGSKGVLDFLIFPLLARELIAGTFLSEQDESHFINALAWTAAIPLEIMRFTAGIALTLLLAPIVAIVTVLPLYRCRRDSH